MLIVFSYFQTISKIKFYADKIIIVSTASTKIFYIKDIEYIKLGSGHLNYMFSLSIKVKDRFIPSSYSCDVKLNKTNFGAYRQTFERVKEILSKYGVPIKEHLDLLAFIKKKTKNSS